MRLLCWIFGHQWRVTRTSPGWMSLVVRDRDGEVVDRLAAECVAIRQYCAHRGCQAQRDRCVADFGSVTVPEGGTTEIVGPFARPTADVV